jgi:ABC-type antimicrobial peptide transport system permease subunit
MFRNYFLSTLRNLYRSKVFALINIFGFAVGIACVILFYLWVSDEMSYDRFHENRGRSYNLLSVFTRGEVNSMSVTPFPLAPTLSERYPEVEAYSRYWNFTSLVNYEEISHMDEKVHLVDPGFLEIFSFPVISGDPVQALSNKSSVVITASEAFKYFGNDDPMGKILTLNQELKLSVSAVLEDPTENTVFDFSMLASIQHVPESRLYNDWTYAGPAYLMLKEGSSGKEFEEKVKDTYAEFNSDSAVQVALQPLDEIYLYRDGKANRIIYVYLFSGIALVILLLACINYMNLSTARSLHRAKEIGLRKTNGARKDQIIMQFLGESMFYSLISLFIALILVELVRPLFNSLTLKQLEIHYGDPEFLGALLFIYLFTSLVSGLYPAFVLSRYRPAQSVEGNTGAHGNRKFLNTLIIIQFTISLALIISSVTINRQVNYIQSKDIGINRQKVVVLPFGGDLVQMYDVLRAELMSLPYVDNVSASYDLPFFLTSGVGLSWEGAGEEETFGVSYNMVDYDFIECMEIEMLEGRSFSADYPSDDSIAYIINETALKRMGMDRATGLNVRFTHPHIPAHLRKGTIIGVVKDFNIRPLSEEIRPLVLRIYRPFYRHMYIRYKSEDPGELLAYLQAMQEKLYPGLPFYYSFLDQEFDQIYEVEYRTSRIIKYFTLISILISCLGLFGMTLFDLELRKREIAIRKVMASSVNQIVQMILRRYFKWILFSFLMAGPLAYYITSRWLQEFEFGIRISPWTYLLSLLAVLSIAFLTIGFLSLRSARANPARVLKYE